MIHLDVGRIMKKTVKQWCLEFGFDWYGPGVHGETKYDYKIFYRNEHGETTCVGFFATAHGPSGSPRHGKKKSGEFLVFPVYRQVIGQKEMSRHKFKMVTGWVQDCLLRKISDYDDYLKHLHIAENQAANQSEISTSLRAPRSTT